MQLKWNVIDGIEVFRCVINRFLALTQNLSLLSVVELMWTAPCSHILAFVLHIKHFKDESLGLTESDWEPMQLVVTVLKVAVKEPIKDTMA